MEEKMEFEKYHKIKLLGNEDNEGILSNPDDELIIEEKMDGGNFGFMYGKSGLIMGSRTREIDADNPNFKGFKRCIDFVREKVGKKKLKGNFIFFHDILSHKNINHEKGRYK